METSAQRGARERERDRQKYHFSFNSKVHLNRATACDTTILAITQNLGSVSDVKHSLAKLSLQAGQAEHGKNELCAYTEQSAQKNKKMEVAGKEGGGIVTNLPLWFYCLLQTPGQ